MLKSSDDNLNTTRAEADQRGSWGETLPTSFASKEGMGKRRLPYINTQERSSSRPARKTKKSVPEENSESKGCIKMSTSRVKKKSITRHDSRKEKTHNSSVLKIEAFDFFHEMLNSYCGSHVFNVLDAASILKQFTPEVIRTVIFVIAENTRKASASPGHKSPGLEGQTLANENEDHQDFEISNITSNAKRKGQRGKWQPVPELVQPRLTSPSSNSCSPVSAAVQALMSFAKTEGQFKKQNVEAATETGPAGLASDVIIENQTDSAEKGLSKTSSGFFEAETMTAVTDSPFLQPMSSMIMLNPDVSKPDNTADVLTTESDTEKQAFESSSQVSQVSDSSTSNIISSCFPWTPVMTNQESGQNEKKLINSDKNLPSISSILSDLSFPLQSTPPLQSAPKETSKSTDSSSVFLQASRFQSQSKSVRVRTDSDTATPGISSSLSSFNYNPGTEFKQGTQSASKNRSRVKPTTKLSTVNSRSQMSLKKCFRTILPKPVESKPEVKFHIGSGKGIRKRNADIKLEFPGADAALPENSHMWLTEKNSPYLDTTITTSENSQVKEDIATTEGVGSHEPIISSLISPKIEKSPSPGIGVSLPENSMYIISNLGTAIELKGIPATQVIPAVCSKTKKTQTSSSGNLEVASALLSMGSTDGNDKKSAKVVSSFNREKATFEIKESSDAQHGDILFTATGTFQIEDIEIDPKKNKIDKDSYECGKCGRVFTSLVYLARHIKRVCPDMSLRKWKCDRCDKAFRHPFGLQQHVYTHTGERPYKCDQCSKAFYSANDLRRHKRTHSGERPYSCSHCQKAFSTTISLKTHTYIHTGERPHKCPHCPKTFATSSKLSRHVVTHSDKRPFSCDTCVKTFNRSGDLRRHYNNVHKLEHGLLSCDLCNKLFATQKCLDNHKNTHNRDGKNRTVSESSTEAIAVNFADASHYTLKSPIDD